MAEAKTGEVEIFPQNLVSVTLYEKLPDCGLDYNISRLEPTTSSLPMSIFSYCLLIGKSVQQKFRPSTNLSTNYNTALQLRYLRQLFEILVWLY